MITIALPLIAGLVLGQQLHRLPDESMVALLPLACLLAWANARGRSPVLLACGLLWSIGAGHLVIGERLPRGLDGAELSLVGRVVGVPQRRPGRLVLVLAVDEAWRGSGPPARVGFRGRARLGWYRTRQQPAPGERWRVRARVRRPHGLLNPGGFDYERWLFERRIGATGTVRHAVRVAPASGPRGLVDRGRARLGDAIESALGDRPAGALVRGLAVGLRDRISQAQWQVLRSTGTTHLMAISGLHIGLVAALAAWVGGGLWRRSARLVRVLPAQRAVVLPALMLAVTYAALAGFSIPTRRALIMIASALLARALLIRPGVSDTLALALLAVLILDPLAALAPGLWLSFGAVTILLAAHCARPVRGQPSRPATLLRAQWVMAIGMIPLTTFHFGYLSLVAPIANLVAVPWTTLVVVPLTLVGSALVEWLPGPGAMLLELAAGALDGLWWILAMLAHWRGVTLLTAAPGPIAVVASAVAVSLLVLPRGTPGRWLLWAWLAPLLAPATSAPAYGEFTLSVLDVGHGLASVVRTAHATLVYDAGPRRRHGLDAGASVLVPFLASQGVRAVDLLMLSHADSDHAGGAAALRRAFPIRRTVAGAALPGATRCRAGQRWVWDGVEFAVLHPRQPGTGNNGSCVLRVRGGATAMLTGDIERRAERELSRRLAGRLRTDLLVAPHHGSRTSSGPQLLAATCPRAVIFSAAHRDRFGMPDADVVARYRAHRARLMDTARNGALLAQFTANRVIVRAYRAGHGGYWHDPATMPAVVPMTRASNRGCPAVGVAAVRATGPPIQVTAVVD